MISVVIPCFNEKENIERFPQTLFPALKELEDFEIIAVDDGSHDGSKDVLKGFQGAQKIKLITHSQNQGMGAALKSGFAAASGDWILVLDADLTFSPKDIVLLIAKQRTESSDLVSGSPWLGLRNPSQVPLLRRFLSRSVNLLYRSTSRIPFSSFTSVFRLYRSSRLRGLKIQSDGFEINAELAALFWAHGFKLSEVPVLLSSRKSGRSKLNYRREILAHLRLIFRLTKLVRMNS